MPNKTDITYYVHRALVCIDLDDYDTATEWMNLARDNMERS